VTSIGSQVFQTCTSLTDFNFAGTVEQWNNISFNNAWSGTLPATYVQCSDGVVPLN
jgi:hypothetical protein